MINTPQHTENKELSQLGKYLQQAGYGYITRDGEKWNVLPFRSGKRP